MSFALRLAALLAFAGAALTIPSSPAGADATVNISHGEFFVTASLPSVEEGNITFNISNDGEIIHEFKVAKSDLPPDALPYNETDFVVDESQVNVLSGTDIFGPGETRTLTVGMEPGNYVLFCNVPSHYSAGSFVGFQVVAVQAPTSTAAPGTTPQNGVVPTAGPSAGTPILGPVGEGPTEGGGGSWWAIAALAALGIALAGLGAVTSRSRS